MTDTSRLLHIAVKGNIAWCSPGSVLQMDRTKPGLRGPGRIWPFRRTVSQGLPIVCWSIDDIASEVMGLTKLGPLSSLDISVIR